MEEFRLHTGLAYRNARWVGPNHLECDVEHPDHGWIPRSCHLSDRGGDVDNAELFTRVKLDPDVPPYEPDTDAERETAEFEAENKVGQLLSALDAFVSNPLRWEQLDNEQKGAFRDYRRALITLPQQKGWPLKIKWPDTPEMPR